MCTRVFASVASAAHEATNNDKRIQAHAKARTHACTHVVPTTTILITCAACLPACLLILSFILLLINQVLLSFPMAWFLYLSLIHI